MESIDVVKAYFEALDSENIEQAEQYLADNYRLVDYTPQPMDKQSMLELIGLLRAALPNLRHSLANIRQEENLIKLTVQRSGTNSAPLDLRKLGIGVVPFSRKFIIFPNSSYEIMVNSEGKITQEKDVSPISPNRRMSGLLKAMGVNMAMVNIG